MEIFFFIDTFTRYFIENFFFILECLFIIDLKLCFIIFRGKLSFLEEKKAILKLLISVVELGEITALALKSTLLDRTVLRILPFFPDNRFKIPFLTIF